MQINHKMIKVIFKSGKTVVISNMSELKGYKSYGEVREFIALTQD